MEKTTAWKNSIKMIIYAVIIILTIRIFNISISFPGIYKDPVGFSATWKFLKLATTILYLAAYILYFLGLTQFSRLQNDSDRKSVSLMSFGILCFLSLPLLTGIPHIAKYLKLCVSAAGYILMMYGAIQLTRSATFPDRARRGAHSIALACSIALAIYVIGFILGEVAIAHKISKTTFYIVESGRMAAYIIIAFLELSGWFKIKNTPNAGSAQTV